MNAKIPKMIAAARDAVERAVRRRWCNDYAAARDRATARAIAEAAKVVRDAAADARFDDDY